MQKVGSYKVNQQYSRYMARPDPGETVFPYVHKVK